GIDALHGADNRAIYRVLGHRSAYQGFAGDLAWRDEDVDGLRDGLAIGRDTGRACGVIGRGRIDGDLEVADEVQRRRDRQVGERPGADVDAGVTSGRREAVNAVGQRRADRDVRYRQSECLRAVGIGQV